MKSEPDTFSIDHLAKRPGKTEAWDGVRNYQARNFMRSMSRGDEVFFYHSNCDEPGIVGLMRVRTEAYPDPTQFDSKHAHYDPGSKPEEPRWSLVEVEFVRKLRRTLTLNELRGHAERLKGLALVMRGSRLSVMPVRPEQWKFILSLEKKDPSPSARGE